ncbi:ABC transporter ATP-binding protein [uncultured Helicobacter sp.]|uniref:ABC transporter ATP-binding protein n=1 Tax=uncultured Helicobacter sp. TaxID=175537 RepID=UPI00374E2E8F
MALLQTHNLGHSFEFLIYEGLDLTLHAGEKIAIVGVSGSGKSTILNNLSTMLAPKSGVVDILDSKDIYALREQDLLRIRRYELGIIFQAHYLFRGFDVCENLELASILSNQPIDMELLERFEIAHTLKQQIGELSGGQQQRLSIARVLSKKPKIIFADEPTGNLDAQTAHKVMECLFEYVRVYNAGIIIATHDMHIAQMCDSVYKLENHHLVRI